MSKPNNPPAFPFVLPDEIGGYQMVEPGMTLRDWFAGQALAAVDNTSRWTVRGDPRVLAERMYMLADAMLAARERG